MATFLCANLLVTSKAETVLNIQTKKSVASVSPDMYGIFFEDINFAADGGLYAEMIKNRSFEFPQHLMGWNIFGNVNLESEGGPFERNPYYVRLSKASHPEKHTGLENEGFRGMGFKKDSTYRFSVYARALSGEQKIRVELIDENDNVIGKTTVAISGNDWKRYAAGLVSSKDVQKGKLRIFFESDGQVDLEHISLFPKDTWKGRENGLRRDLAQALADLKPGVMRFPGGCIVEGTDINTRYNWKNSVGPVENRPLNENRWNYTFQDRLFPDYYQTYGLGFFEFFQLAEEIGASPLPVLNCGLACQYQNHDSSANIPVDKLDPYVQDALDLIEFANGPVTSKWGKLRSDMGHPASFKLKYLAIGNEQWGHEYTDRLPVFVKAIRAKYPEIQIVGSSGPSADGKEFDYLWPEMKRIGADLVDEHYYKAPDWFYSNAGRYDAYNRKGPKVFAGEYASHDYKSGKANNFLAALSEAAFMTGLERNADVVRLATYAPLFAHVDAWQWNPDLIWYDNLRSVKTPDYYVQQLYSRYKGTDVLSALSAGKPLEGQDGLYASAVRDSKAGTILIKAVNKDSRPQSLKINLEGLGQFVYQVKMIRMQSDNLKAVNTLDKPENVVPEETDMELAGSSFELSLLPQSFTVLEIKVSGEKIAGVKVSAKGRKQGLTEKHHKLTVYTIGDSTVKNGDGTGSNGQWGWGAFLGDYLNADSCVVVNRALGGRSSRTYIEEGLWANTLSRLQPGDFVLLQFGHNDGGEPNIGRARGTLKGNGDESQKFVLIETTHDTIDVHSYGWYIRQYVNDAKAKGAIPVVVSLIPRNMWKDGKVIRSDDSYALWAKQAAEQAGSYFLDLNKLVSDRYDVMGQDIVSNLFFGDHTHTSLAGAKINAMTVSQGLKQLKNCRLAGFVK